MLPILIREPASARVDVFMSTVQQEPWVSDFAAAEVASAVSRLVRTGRLQASDGAAGLSMMLDSGSEFAAIISDLRMPGCSGMELHDHVAAVAPELLDRIIFSTGDVASRDAADFVKRTHCIVMQKPFELRALEQVVNRMRQLTTTH